MAWGAPPAAATGLVEAVALRGVEQVYLIIVVGMSGLLIGSFLNVVIYRVPEGRSVVRPGSACPHCGQPIGARDNLPVVSWLLLRGRSRCCGEPISLRYPLVEATTAAAFAGVTAWTGLSWLLPALLYLAAISIALAIIDLDVHRLPNAIVLPSYPVAAALLVPAALVAGEPGRLLRAAIGAFVLYAFYFLLMVVYPRGMGFGDVKLAGVLGLYLGFFGWSHLAIGAFLGFMVGGVVGVGLILGGRAGRKTLYPYGPSMIVGAWLALTAAEPIADWYLSLSGIS
jgi:leader peptidase (prepilin peptidase)/N-methyltransferase